MSGITLLVEDPKWRSHRGLTARLTRAADAARRSARLKGGFTILLAGDKKLRALNHDFRAKDKPTNVLSFPMAAEDELEAAANPGPEGPGPLISMMAQAAGSFPIPVTIVPGDLSDADIDGLS